MTEIIPSGLLNGSFDKPVLALLGSFSSDAIFSILKGIYRQIKKCIYCTKKPKLVVYHNC
jgi:hypothetical protein